MSNRFLRLQFLSLFFLVTSFLQAQIVGTDAFMQGDFAEVGINDCGAYSSSVAPPAGYVVTGLTGLTFIADSDMDGWDVGDPEYCGDYAIPGSPVEGWGIQIDGVNYYNTDQGCFTSDVDGSIVSWADDGDSIEVIWQGNIGGITITQRSVLYADALYFVTYVTLTNESGDDYTDIYYRRNIDPDNENLATGSFTTINTVESNPALGDAAAIVTAVGETYGCYLALVANNLFSNGSYGNFGTTSGTSVSSSYLGTDGFNLEGTNTADEAIQMSFWIPALPNGGAATFAFAYVFSEDAVEDALEDTYITGDEATDVGIISFEGPSSGCGLGDETVTVKIFNYGFEAATDIPVSYQVDGGAIVSETFAGTLDPGTFGTHTFGTTADLSVEADYTITSWTSLDGDTVLFNDTSELAISNIPVISSFPYTEDFEDGSSGWLSGGTASSWELGYPSASVIDGPPPATPSSEESWATSLFDFYNINEDSWVQSPCFDFTDLVIPYVKFDIWWETYDFWDGARLEYSLDAGASWTEIGGIGTGDNWYSGECFSFDFDPVTFVYNPAWEGSGGEWLTAQHDISFLAGESQVQFRIHFKSYLFDGFSDGVAFDNFFVGDPFPNDVGVVDVVDPFSSPDLSASEEVTVEVHNFGSLSQTGFPVAYQLDGGTIVTETFTDVIEPGTSMEFTFAATADLSVDGDYEICSWTALVGDEDVSNDSICKTVANLLPVTGTDAYYIYSNTTGGEPWFSTSNSEAMDLVFPDGWTQDFFETIDPDAVFSEATCFVFLEGSDSHAAELEDFLDENITLIEGWVASGGHLFLNAGPNEGDGMDFGFGGTELIYSWFTSNAVAYDDSHPIFDGPYTPVGTAWTGGSFGHARVAGIFDTLIVDEFTPSNVVAAEKFWGAGTVVFGGMTTANFHSPLEEAANLRANIIAYLAACTVSDIDLGLSSFIAPDNGCGLGEEAVTVKIRNYGFEPQTDIPVNYQVDGGAVVSETWLGTLESGETVEYTFATLADLSAIAEYEIVAWTSFPGDTILSNDSTDATVTNIPVISSYPYFTDYEDGAAGWTTDGSDLWELGSPAGATIDGPPDTDPDSENSWMTDLDAEYPINSDVWVQSPCFDFTDLVLPFVRFDIWWDTYDFWDGARLEYSLDAGGSWEPIGDIGTGDNWYSGECYSFDFDPVTFFYNPAWEGVGGGWKTAQHDVSFLAGETQVQFRMHFKSYAFIGFADGVAFDNFYISDPFADDIGVVSIISPNTDADLTSSETVTVEVENFGTNTQTDFIVSYQVDGGTIVSETFTDILDPGAVIEFTFATGANLAAYGPHEVCAWTELDADEELTNDSICKPVTNLEFNNYYIYSNTTGGEPWFSTTNTAAMDAVFASGWTQEFFETTDVESVFSESTCFVFLEGSDSHAAELETFLSDNSEAIESWVEAGGRLFLNAAPNEGDGMDFGFDGTELIYSYFTGNGEAYDDTHPIFEGPFTPVGTTWSGSSFGHARIEGDFDTLIVDQFSPDNVVAAEKAWGEGIVVFGGMTTNNFHSPLEEAANLRANIISYLSICESAAPVDIAMVALIAPASGCGLGEEVVTVEIENLSGIAVTGVDVTFFVDGATGFMETVTDVIDPFSTYTYTFTGAFADLSAPGPHTIETTVFLAGDIDSSNDTITTDVTSLATPIVDLPDNGTFCDELELDAGNPGATYLWSTGATTQEIVVTESGTYSVTVTDPTTGCAATDEVVATIEYSPVASFTYTATGVDVTFTNTSTGGASYSWSFGDGETSTEVNPDHTYVTPGVYSVTLTVSNGCGSDFYTTTISVANSLETILSNATEIYPNPTSGLTIVSVDFDAVYDVQLEIVNQLGQTVWSNMAGGIQTETYEVDLSEFADGIYTLKVQAGDNQFSKPIILTK